MGRTEVEVVGKEEQAEMTAMMDRILAAVEGHPRSISLSVLSQVIVGNLGDEAELSGDQFYNRTVAMLALINIMREGATEREMDQGYVAETAHDLAMIASCGSRGVMVPSLVSVLVGAVANGRDKGAAGQSCVAEIAGVLERFGAQLKALDESGSDSNE